ncbi:3-deoxy-7-phosphoheptulonate synthase [Thiococcus pfennigii]|jgi:3-deoxy-7-phosphoheptulonate synthase|uniref:3-deoxy-7-phosphoheptulonate synthase n=1 Tax=Thiococcus pfennigii TaxID=1057 RepID=UPI001904C1FD|nr:3-deoxy-7-phosphoheptulonate synthase [Thiococcus pfennigii]MBK1701053.1 3-deoxy-7-phosphoheptulonate synthase [Thiococcus pfennigii]MBK1732936.1 3-deoxy-7-phosphoheptulonate synthase [Thiococcus pfennigii]
MNESDNCAEQLADMEIPGGEPGLVYQPLTSPRVLHQRYPLSARGRQQVVTARVSLRRILQRQDPRLILVLGPCSVHDPVAALDYAVRLSELARRVDETLYVLMRVYVEKPRTRVGWKGLLSDPYLDGTAALDDGLELSRRLMLEVSDLGLPVAVEVLQPLVAPYLQDIVAWSAVGARTSESQIHRELASGLPSVVGFKNGTDGSLEAAVNAMVAARAPHCFPSLDHEGRAAVVHTSGNPHTHLILRGGRHGPNYSPAEVAVAERALRGAQLPENILIDASHENSYRDHGRQGEVVEAVAGQIEAGNRSIVGLMLESNLVAGKQACDAPRGLRYGVSITDGCLDWEATEALVLALAERVRPVLAQRVT